MLNELIARLQTIWTRLRYRAARLAETGDRGSISAEWVAIAAVIIAGALVIGRLIITFATGIAENLQGP